MNLRIAEIFQTQSFVNKVKSKLPKLFHLAELESSRAGKIGMEVGSVREKVITSLFLYKFGQENVQTELPITEAETDVIVFNTPISIKTITGKNFGGIKLIWTVDAQKALEFSKSYKPSCDMVLVQIKWNAPGGFYYIPIEAQKEIMNELTREKYIKLPKAGTNPRGVEMSSIAMKSLVEHNQTHKITIDWKKEKIEFNPFKKWIEHWKAD